ncbi:hypothetical protein SISNIDRAFT_464650 [Sistotremastrum niveocremeum HHB9708]|uniref:Uncharacterized protein n=1 Tax=Sistotremastrum niveocremeum HHB9708 TaxID=1314777 RepID=A0A164X5S3_9AGAM|nr:hypothetical protein SISNIDRAFT_464650 [Sistotremastrum niveocremeum HHB9708]
MVFWLVMIITGPVTNRGHFNTALACALSNLSSKLMASTRLKLLTAGQKISFPRESSGGGEDHPVGTTKYRFEMVDQALRQGSHSSPLSLNVAKHWKYSPSLRVVPLGEVHTYTAQYGCPYIQSAARDTTLRQSINDASIEARLLWTLNLSASDLKACSYEHRTQLGRLKDTFFMPNRVVSFVYLIISVIITEFRQHILAPKPTSIHPSLNPSQIHLFSCPNVLPVVVAWEWGGCVGWWLDEVLVGSRVHELSSKSKVCCLFAFEVLSSKRQRASLFVRKQRKNNPAGGGYGLPDFPRVPGMASEILADIHIRGYIPVEILTLTRRNILSPPPRIASMIEGHTSNVSRIWTRPHQQGEFSFDFTAIAPATFTSVETRPEVWKVYSLLYPFPKWHDALEWHNYSFDLCCDIFRARTNLSLTQFDFLPGVQTYTVSGLCVTPTPCTMPINLANATIEGGRGGNGKKGGRGGHVLTDNTGLVDIIIRGATLSTGGQGGNSTFIGEGGIGGNGGDVLSRNKGILEIDGEQA